MKNNFLKRFSAFAIAVLMVLSTIMFDVPLKTTKTVSAMNTTISSHDFVRSIGPGWNLGNLFDAQAGFNRDNDTLANGFSWLGGGLYRNTDIRDLETAWIGGRDFLVTQQFIQAVHAAGFRAIRIPVTWFKATDYHLANSTYNIRPEWMARIRQVVQWAYDLDMHIILNTHHENGFIGRYRLTNDTMTQAERRMTRLWEQIAREFNNDFGEKLIFAGLNEPRGRNGEWTGGTAETRANIDKLNQIFVNTVRATSGNNSHRFLIVPTHGATANSATLNSFVVPTDPANRIILAVHTYSPFRWAHDGEGSYGGIQSIRTDLNLVDTHARRLGVPVILSEWGSTAASTLSQRVQHAEDYTTVAREFGMATFWWDNGSTSTSVGDHGFGLFNRRTRAQTFPTIVQAIIRGTGTPGPTPSPSPSPSPTAGVTAVSVGGTATIAADATGTARQRTITVTGTGLTAANLQVIAGNSATATSHQAAVTVGTPTINANRTSATVVLTFPAASTSAVIFHIRARTTNPNTSWATAPTTVTVAAAAAPTFGISLSQTGTLTFPAQTVGYDEQPWTTITVTNTGNQPTGALTVTAPTGFSIQGQTRMTAGIGVGDTQTFDVRPSRGSAVGTHTGAVTVSGGNGITSRSFNVSFTVNPAAVVAGVTAVSVGGTATIAADATGTARQRTVTVTGTGLTAANLQVIAGNSATATSHQAAVTVGTPTINAQGTSATVVLTFPAASANAIIFHIRARTTTPNTSWATAPTTVTVAATAATQTYGISLSQTGTLTFPSMEEGYGEQTWFQITVTNTGNQPTGPLEINEPAGFSIQGRTSLRNNGVAVGGTQTFDVRPSRGSSAGTHTAVVSVTGANGISASFNVSFTVTAPSASVSAVSVGGSNTIAHDSNTRTRTVTVTGTRLTASNVQVRATNSATSTTHLTAVSVGTPTINAQGTSATVVLTFPAAGATATEFFIRARTTSPDTSWATATTTVTVAAIPQTFGISLSETGTFTFPAVYLYYEPIAAHTVTITNTGNQATGALTAALSGTNAGSFALSRTSVPSVAVGGTQTFTLRPNDGLAAGNYNATVTVSGGNGISASFNVSFSVPPNFTVTFDLDGGEHNGGGALSQEVSSGENAVEPIDLKRRGFVFGGWEGAFTNVTSNRTVTAKWLRIGAVSTGGTGNVTSADVIYLARHIAGHTDFAIPDKRIANFRGEDRTLNANDIKRLLQWLVGYDFEFLASQTN